MDFKNKQRSQLSSLMTNIVYATESKTILADRVFINETPAEITINHRHTEVISFVKCVVEGNRVWTTVSSTSLQFSDCIFEEDQSFQIAGNGSLILSNCIFEKHLKIECRGDRFSVSMTFCNSLSLSAVTLSSRIKNLIVKTESDIQITEKGDLINCSLGKSTIHCTGWKGHSGIESCAFNNLIQTLDDFSTGLLKNITVKNSYNVRPMGNTLTRSKLEIENSNIGEVKFDEFFLSTVSLTENSIGHLVLTGTNKKTDLTVRKCGIRKMTFDKFANQEEIVISDSKTENGCQIIVKNSDMSKISLNKNDFSISKFTVAHSDLSGMFLSQTDFPKKIVDEDGNDDWENSQTTFGQISLVYNRQGDSFRSQEYHRSELYALMKNTSWLTRKFPQKASLFLNYLSNNFGGNWLQAIVFTIAVGIFFYFLFIYGSICKFWNYERDDIYIFFFKFMNPIRIDPISEIFVSPYISFSPGKYLIDFFGRIFITYGYYQTIQAFRRYGKSN